MAKLNKRTKASVIIVSHNNKGIIAECLNALRKQSFKNFDVYMVDNDSSDGSEEFIKDNYPEVNFISLSEGVSKKRNYAIEKSKAEYIITVDSDAVLSRDWLEKAIEYMDKHKEVGICCGKLVGREGLIDFAGGLYAKNGGASDIGHGEKDSEKYNHFKRMSAMTTAGAIIRRAMFEEIGGFDEDYYYGFEDSDYGLRANFAGWKVIYNPDLVGIHGYHSTVSGFDKKRTNRFEFFIKRNRVLTLLKNFEKNTIIHNLPLIFLSLIGSMKNRPIATLKAYFWIMLNFGKIKEWRRKVQEKKRISDREMFDSIYFPKTIRGYGKESKISSFIRKMNSRSLKNLTFFITTRCNSKCKHCFYWRELKKARDIPLEDIEKVISKFQNIYSVSLSGGEPFIRKDIEKIVRMIVRYTDAKVIDIPTNCLIDISGKLEKMLEENPETAFSIVCSLDGMREEHDFVRGVPGGFDKTVQMIHKLGEIKKRYPNFKALTVNTVITNNNYEKIPELIGFVKTLPVTNHAFDIIRGEHQHILGMPTIEQLKKLNKLRYKTAKYYNKNKPFLERIFYNSKEKEIINIQLNALKNKKWPFECTAGKTDLVIESDGTARICELQPKIGSLLNKTPEELLKSEEAKMIFERIKAHGCDCTHVCNLCSSMDCYPRNIFFNRIINLV
ncbi:glycosyltransferase [Candidatus Pacearchaeota archaeon]|nr:glycosyltransferase [Candidatus Pacearchaeota archaeon]